MDIPGKRSRPSVTLESRHVSLQAVIPAAMCSLRKASVGARMLLPSFFSTIRRQAVPTRSMWSPGSGACLAKTSLVSPDPSRISSLSLLM